MTEETTLYVEKPAIHEVLIFDGTHESAMAIVTKSKGDYFYHNPGVSRDLSKATMRFSSAPQHGGYPVGTRFLFDTRKPGCHQAFDPGYFERHYEQVNAE